MWWRKMYENVAEKEVEECGGGRSTRSGGKGSRRKMWWWRK